MSDKKVLAAFLAATVAVAGGSAWAASDTAATPPAQTAAQKDFGKLSADGAKGYQDLALTRLAIYDGKVADAKKFVEEADTAFGKSKSDDAVFMKAEHEMMTAQQARAKTAKNKTSKTMADQTKPEVAANAKSTDAKTSGDNAKTSDDNVKTSGDNAKPVAWLPVDGAVSLDEDYTMNPAKKKAVADANDSLAKGDKTGALNHLKLADVNMSVVLEVVPLDQTLSDVHQAAQLIESGKYYEGSQMLRKVQMSARYDVSDIVAAPKAAAAAGTAAKPSDAKPAATH